MVTRLFLLCVFLVSVSFASESGQYAYRGQKFLSQGKFALAYSSYEGALLASRKESDLLSEARILLSMAQIRIYSLDFELSDSLLSQIRPEVLDANTQLALIGTKMALLNAQEQFEKTLNKEASVTEEMLDKAPETLIASYFTELSYAYAAKNNRTKAEEFLEKVRKELSKSDGRYLLAKARVSDLLGDLTQADSLYTLAEKNSIQENKIYRTASILYYRALLSEKQKDIKKAEDFRKRSAHAFELMGLPKPQKRSLNKE